MDEAQALHNAVGRAKQGWARGHVGAGSLERLDPEFVKRADGFKQVALDRTMAERERVREPERLKIGIEARIEDWGWSWSVSSTVPLAAQGCLGSLSNDNGGGQR